MGAPKGHKRYGGRTKGTPNKRTSEALEAVREICAREKCTPIEGMCRLANDEKNEPALRFQCFKELASYMYTKPREPVQVGGLDGKPIDVNNPDNAKVVEALVNMFSEQKNESGAK